MTKKYGRKSTDYTKVKGRNPRLTKPRMVTVRLNTVTEQEWQQLIEHCAKIGVSVNIMLCATISGLAYMNILDKYAQLIQIQANKEKKKPKFQTY